MIEDRVIYALNNMLNIAYESGTSKYTLTEPNELGRSSLSVNVSTDDSICVKNYDKYSKWGILNTQKIHHMQKCVDHFILSKNNSGVWTLHIFEMKTSIGVDTWHNIKYKVRASYLSIKALAVYLGIQIDDQNITVYTTYEHEKLYQPTVRPKLGEKIVDIKRDEWDSNIIRVPIIISSADFNDCKNLIVLKHCKIRMNRSADNVLESEFSI